MAGQWMIWLLVTGFAYAFGNDCNPDIAAECYYKLEEYEGRAFPLYGREAELEKTCKTINSSFECLQTYFEKCNGKKECNDTCKGFIRFSQSFMINTGLKNLAEELCEENSGISQSYLESYDCLEKNFDAYSECHNKSMMSLQYLNSITDASAIPKRCCYFSWYHDCFINITKENCDEDATEYVKTGLSKLVGHLAEKLCMTSDITCSSPPLDSDEVGHKEPDKVGHKEPDKVGHKEPEKEKKHVDVPVQKVKVIDDSKKDKHESNSASIISCPIAGTVVAFYFILFMKLLIH